MSYKYTEKYKVDPKEIFYVPIECLERVRDTEIVFHPYYGVEPNNDGREVKFIGLSALIKDSLPVSSYMEDDPLKYSTIFPVNV